MLLLFNRGLREFLGLGSARASRAGDDALVVANFCPNASPRRVRPMSKNTEHPTSNVQRSTSNAQRPTLNAQRPITSRCNDVTVLTILTGERSDALELLLTSNCSSAGIAA